LLGTGFNLADCRPLDFGKRCAGAVYLEANLHFMKLFRAESFDHPRIARQQGPYRILPKALSGVGWLGAFSLKPFNQLAR
jgi:hypothetical protein